MEEVGFVDNEITWKIGILMTIDEAHDNGWKGSDGSASTNGKNCILNTICNTI